MKIFHKILQQTGWQLVGKLVTVISTLLIIRLITSNYGEAGTGLYTLILTYLSFFFLGNDLGLNAYILPKLKEHRQSANELFNFRLIISLLLMLAANLLVYLLPFKAPEFQIGVLIGSLTILMSGVFNTTNLIFQTNLSYQRSTIVTVVSTLLMLPWVFYLITLQVPVVWLISASLLGYLVNNLLALILVRKFYHFSFQLVSLTYPLKVLKVAWPLSAALLLNVVYFRIDTFILSSTHGLETVGIYNLAYQVFQNALVLPTFIMNGFYPIMLQTLKDKPSLFVQRTRLAAWMLLGMAVVGTILTLILSPTIISVLAPKGFVGSVQALQILGLGFPAFFLSSLVMWVLVSVGEYKKVFSIYLVGLFVNLGLNIILIPQYSYMAAAWVTVFCEYLILILQILMIFRLRIFQIYTK